MKTTNVVIRNPEMSDLQRIIHINRVCLPENYSVTYFISILRKYKDICVVAEIEDEVVGYILTTHEKSYFSVFSATKPKAHIVSVAVLPDYRGRGIGKRMIEEVLDILKENHYNEVFLEVRVSNYIARSLYMKYGFQDTKLLKQYYKDGEDGLMMTCNLKKYIPP